MTVWKGKATTGVCALVGVVFTAIGLYLMISTLLFQANAVRVPGTVVADQSWGGEHKPRVSFETLDGKAMEFASHPKTRNLMYNVGEKVTVLYDPADPSNAKISSFYELWLTPVILLAIGLIGLGATVCAGYRLSCRRGYDP